MHIRRESAQPHALALPRLDRQRVRVDPLARGHVRARARVGEDVEYERGPVAAVAAVGVGGGRGEEGGGGGDVFEEGADVGLDGGEVCGGVGGRGAKERGVISEV